MESWKYGGGGGENPFCFIKYTYTELFTCIL